MIQELKSTGSWPIKPVGNNLFCIRRVILFDLQFIAGLFLCTGCTVCRGRMDAQERLVTNSSAVITSNEQYSHGQHSNNTDCIRHDSMEGGGRAKHDSREGGGRAKQDARAEEARAEEARAEDALY